MRTLVVGLLVCATAALPSADIGPPTDLRALAANARRIVVGRVLSVSASFESNEFGDQIIVSRVFVEIDEALKGPFMPVLEVLVEGGTVGDITLRVSDMPVVRTNERAVLFLEESPGGAQRPTGRGRGILKLDSSNRVQNGTLTLDDIRALVRATPQN